MQSLINLCVPFTLAFMTAGCAGEPGMAIRLERSCCIHSLGRKASAAHACAGSNPRPQRSPWALHRRPRAWPMAQAEPWGWVWAQHGWYAVQLQLADHQQCFGRVSGCICMRPESSDHMSLYIAAYVDGLGEELTPADACMQWSLGCRIHVMIFSLRGAVVHRHLQACAQMQYEISSTITICSPNAQCCLQPCWHAVCLKAPLWVPQHRA